MKLNIGNVAEGENYFDRPYLNEKFWRLLNKSGHISIAAPRRVGKTSFMHNIVSIPSPGFEIEYIITESINDSNSFFKKIYKVLLSQLAKSKKFKEFIEDAYKRLDIKKLSLTSIEFGKTEIDFFEEIKLLLKRSKENDRHIVLMIDEYSQTLENIILDKGENDAKLFLHQCRELRIDPACKGKISFVYTGSVGLENLVASLNESKTITDIGRFEMPTLTSIEAKKLIDKILNKENYIFAEDDKLYLIEKLRWLLPYFIQIIMSEIDELCIEQNTKNITKQIIDSGFINSLKNRSYFEHWVTRLRIMFKGNEFNCIKELLSKTAINNIQTKYEFHDIATKHQVEDITNQINRLIHDGYISKTDEGTHYRFNSPLLQEWWLLNIVN